MARIGLDLPRGRFVRSMDEAEGLMEEITFPVIAWTGTNRVSQARGRAICLFKTTWQNPFPETRVKTIDFVSSTKAARPFLVAITAEP